MRRTPIYHPESDCYFHGPFRAESAEHDCIELDPCDLKAYQKIETAWGPSISLPDFDFETYSEAGYVFRKDRQKWVSITDSPPHGIGAVGAAVYSEHPSTEVLSLAYNLKDGLGKRLWVPGMPPPLDLFKHIHTGGLLEAHNSSFEYYIWLNVCYERMGWPVLPLALLRDSMAKAQAFSLPGKLGDAGRALGLDDVKDDDGTRLLNKFSKPRQPTKKNRALRLYPADDPQDGQKLYNYNLQDIVSETALSIATPDLSNFELRLWLLDQRINAHGVYIDHEGLQNCISIVDAAKAKYETELVFLTGGLVTGVGKVKVIREWLETLGFCISSLDAEHVERALKSPIPPGVKPEDWEKIQKVLKIRSSLGSNSVKKLYSIERRLTKAGYLHDLFAYAGADRTARWAGRGPQPQNLPNSGPKVRRCEGCGRVYGNVADFCPECRTPCAFSEEVEWGNNAVKYALEVFKTQDLAVAEAYFGDAVAAVSGCLRGLFSASPGHDFICSDYSAIEAVVLAMLAGEQWRIDVFRTHGKIYEMSASKITGTPFEDMMSHKEKTGEHHPLRKKIGKVAELASGYQGSVGAWKAFGADKHFENDDAILEAVRTWRKESPAIVDLWYKVQDFAILAIQNPHHEYEHRGLKFRCIEGVFQIQLLSGRRLNYHDPKLIPDTTPWGKETFKITYMGRDSYTHQWTRLDTYGGKLVENITQATARDILANALLNLDDAGYFPVLHVHDEAVAEIQEGFGSVGEFETIMNRMPDWATGWPIHAAGGWRGKRYRKD